jgi:adenylate cyclase
MSLEIERKFLVRNIDFLKSLKGTPYAQAYLNTKNERTVRVRIAGKKGLLTIKGKARGMTRQEYEYEIPLKDAKEMMLSLCKKSPVRKIRYKVKFKGFVWDVDVYKGDNEGLVTAEIELDHENQEFERPEWLGQEVTYDKRYRNSRLFTHPYKNWE